MTPERAIYRLGSTIGLIGGAVFVLVNRTALPPLASTAALVCWIVLLMGAIWAVWIRRAPQSADPLPPRPRAGLAYGLACAGMVLLIVAGSNALRLWDMAGAIPPLVAAAVGLHFLPFAQAFRAPFFTLLGLAMTVIGGVGFVLAFVVGVTWAASAAVLAGLVMTGLIAYDAARP